MRRPATVLLAVVVLLSAASRAASGQGFHGGVRGAAHDAGGVVPGVEVTLTNEATEPRAIHGRPTSAASTCSRRVRARHLHAEGHAFGFKTIERRGSASGRSSSSTIDVALEVGALAGDVTVTGESPLIETSNASQRHRARLGAAADAAVAGPHRVPDRRDGADGHLRPATRSSTASRIRPTPRCSRSAAARAAATTTRSTACRSPTCATAPAPTRRSKRSRT